MSIQAMLNALAGLAIVLACVLAFLRRSGPVYVPVQAGRSDVREHVKEAPGARPYDGQACPTPMRGLTP